MYCSKQLYFPSYSCAFPWEPMLAAITPSGQQCPGNLLVPILWWIPPVVWAAGASASVCGAVQLWAGQLCLGLLFPCALRSRQKLPSWQQQLCLLECRSDWVVCLVCCTRDQMWLILSAPPVRHNRFPEELPAPCLVYKHLCNSTSDTVPWCFVLPRTVLPRELERKETISCWGFGSPAHAISTPSAHWAPAPVCWSPGVSVRLLRSFRCMPRKCHLSIFQGRLQSPGASHAAQHSCVCAPQQPLSPAHHSHTSAFETLFVLSSMFLWGFNVIAGFGKIFSHCTKKWYASALGKRVPAGLVYKEWPETS